VFGRAEHGEARGASSAGESTHLALRGGGVGALHGGIGAAAAVGDEFMGGSLGGDLENLFAQGGDGKTAAGRMSILAAFANEAKRGRRWRSRSSSPRSAPSSA
jgi:hypothetical protein